MTPREEFEEVILRDVRAASPHRQSALELLEPVTRSLAPRLVAAARAKGIDLRIIETLRSRARQLDCWRRKTSKLKVGTHCFALAFDVGIYIDGELVESGALYERVMPGLCRPLGLVSGCDWGAPGVSHSWVDPDHVQRLAKADQQRLFSGAWYPDEGYDPYGEAVAAPAILPGAPLDWDAWPGVPFALPGAA